MRGIFGSAPNFDPIGAPNRDHPRLISITLLGTSNGTGGVNLGSQSGANGLPNHNPMRAQRLKGHRLPFAVLIAKRSTSSRSIDCSRFVLLIYDLCEPKGIDAIRLEIEHMRRQISRLYVSRMTSDPLKRQELGRSRL